MILCVGTSGSGKTSLLKVLQQKCVKEAGGPKPSQESKKASKGATEEPIPETRFPATISTVGTNILTLPGKGKVSLFFVIHFSLAETSKLTENVFVIC